MPEALFLSLGFIAVKKFSEVGMMTPYIAGSVGLLVAKLEHYDLQGTTWVIVYYYLISYFCSGGLDSSSNIILGVRSGNSFIKLVTLLIFIFLPIGKPIFLVPGILAVIMALLLMQPRAEELVYVVTTIVIYTLTIALIKHFTSIDSFALPIIASIAVPRLCRQEPLEEESSYQPNWFNYGTSFFLTWITPGLSTSLVSGAVLKRNSTATAILEAASEGWVIGLLLKYSIISTKSPLGDLLSFVNADQVNDLLNIHGLLYTIAGAFLMSLIRKPDAKPNKLATASVLVAQSVIMVGLPVTIIFCLLGFVFPHYKETKPLLIMSQMI